MSRNIDYRLGLQKYFYDPEYRKYGLETETLGLQRPSYVNQPYELYRLPDSVRLRWAFNDSDYVFLFYGDQGEQKDAFIARILSSMNRKGDAHRMIVFDHDGGLERVDSRIRSFSSHKTRAYYGYHYHYNRVPVEKALEVIQEYKRDVDVYLSENNLLSASYTSGLIVTLSLSSSDLARVMSDERLNAMFTDVVFNSWRENLRVFVLLDDARVIQPGVLDTLEYAIYLGDTNKQYLLDNTSKSFRHDYTAQKIIGVASIAPDRLLELCSITYIPSDEVAAFNEAIGDEEAAYRRYLESLDTGLHG